MSVFAGSIARRVLVVALIALTGLYLLWFAATPSPWITLAVFAIPPAALAMAALRGCAPGRLLGRRIGAGLVQPRHHGRVDTRRRSACSPSRKSCWRW